MHLAMPPTDPWPWRSYSPSPSLEVSAGKRCRPRSQDALGGVADSTGLVFLQNRIAAHFGCAIARIASMLAPKRVCGRRRC